MLASCILHHVCLKLKLRMVVTKPLGLIGAMCVMYSHVDSMLISFKDEVLLSQYIATLFIVLLSFFLSPMGVVLCIYLSF